MFTNIVTVFRSIEELCLKLLRKRKGYTTNSSASNEWLPSASGSSPISQTQQTNMISVGIIIGVVIALFLLEKLVRTLWSVFKKRNPDD